MRLQKLAEIRREGEYAVFTETVEGERPMQIETDQRQQATTPQIRHTLGIGWFYVRAAYIGSGAGTLGCATGGKWRRLVGGLQSDGVSPAESPEILICCTVATDYVYMYTDGSNDEGKGAIFRKGSVVTIHISGADPDELRATTVPDWALPNWAVHGHGWKATGGYVRLLSSGKFTVDDAADGYLACTFTYLAKN